MISIFDMKNKKWTSHRIFSERLTSKIFLLDRETIFWLEENNKLQVYSLTNEGELNHKVTINCKGINAKIINNNLNRKLSDGYYILTEEEESLQQIDDQKVKNLNLYHLGRDRNLVKVQLGTDDDKIQLDI